MERLRELELFSWHMKRLRGISPAGTVQREWSQSLVSDAQCQEPEAMGTNLNAGEPI